MSTMKTCSTKLCPSNYDSDQHTEIL